MPQGVARSPRRCDRCQSRRGATSDRRHSNRRAVPVAAACAPLHSRYRRAEISVHEDFTENLIGACVAGEVDLGLVALPFDDARVAVEPLFSEQLLVALAPGHLLAKRRRITLDELTCERFVLLSEIHCLGTQIVRFCERQGCVPALTCRSAQLMTVQEMVAMGQGSSSAA